MHCNPHTTNYMCMYGDVAVSSHDTSLVAAISWGHNKLTFNRNVYLKAPLCTFEVENGQPLALCFVPGSNRLLVQTSASIQEFSMSSGKLRTVKLCQFHESGFASIVCDGSVIYCTGSSQSIQAFDYATGELLCSVPCIKATRGLCIIDNVLYACNMWKHELYRVTNGRCNVIAKTQKYPFSILCVNSDRILVISRTGDIVVWDSTWKQQSVFYTGTYGPVFSIHGRVYCIDDNDRVCFKDTITWECSGRRAFIINILA